MGLFLLARRAGSTDFDARRALPPRVCFRLGVLAIRAMDTLPFDAECAVAQASPGNPQLQGSDHYIGKACRIGLRREGPHHLSKIQWVSVSKRHPPKRAGAIAASQYTAGGRNRPPAPPPRAFKNTEGVGERPGLRVRRQMLCRREVRSSSVSSSSLSAERGP